MATAERFIRLGVASLFKEAPAQGVSYPAKDIQKAPANRQMGRKGR